MRHYPDIRAATLRACFREAEVATVGDTGAQIEWEHELEPKLASDIISLLAKSELDERCSCYLLILALARMTSGPSSSRQLLNEEFMEKLREFEDDEKFAQLCVDIPETPDWWWWPRH